MKLFLKTLAALLFFLIFYACTKKNATSTPLNSDPLFSLYGTWQTTDLGGVGDTGRIKIDTTSTNALASYANAALTNATGDRQGIAVFQTISAAGVDTFKMAYPYNYGMDNTYSSITDGILVLETKTTFTAIPFKDPWNNMTPAVSHWVKIQ